MQIELSEATIKSLQYAFGESQKRGLQITRYLKTPESFAEALLDRAIQYQVNYFAAADKRAIGENLERIQAKKLSGKPLTSEEQKLLDTFLSALKS